VQYDLIVLKAPLNPDQPTNSYYNTNMYDVCLQIIVFLLPVHKYSLFSFRNICSSLHYFVLSSL